MSNLTGTTRRSAQPTAAWGRAIRHGWIQRAKPFSCAANTCLASSGWLLLADRAPFHSLGRNFRGRHSQFDKGDVFMVAAIFAGAAIALWVLHRLLARQDGERTFHSRRALFQALCRAHALNRGERQLLARLARWHHLTEPGRVFLEIDRFDIAGAPASLTARAVELESLRQRLFADSASAPAAMKITTRPNAAAPS